VRCVHKFLCAIRFPYKGIICVYKRLYVKNVVHKTNRVMRNMAAAHRYLNQTPATLSLESRIQVSLPHKLQFENFQ